MHFLTAIIISLSALAAAVPMPAETPAPSQAAQDDSIYNAAVIPTECAQLKDVHMACVAGTENPKEGTQQCKYTDDAGKPATLATTIKCTPKTQDPATSSTKAKEASAKSNASKAAP
ncbi:hypothetical protein PpBr36_04309 [Pyricularia pennisetigena]|uniref:hypothetical protein n=1 Tax=Pyricularia pennisetigena TaxID=1578925 RepID=UPI001153C62E|nr:hypothetical protein PpBr36_04309 [Pyricularia pennisetigena]TLS26898.1 hypothetical protein PpBr36_04309 [Pyricularia pennisetigena]